MQMRRKLNVEKQAGVPVHSGVPVVPASEFLRVVQGVCFLPISILYRYQFTSPFTFRMVASAYTSRNRDIAAQRDVFATLSCVLSPFSPYVRIC